VVTNRQSNRDWAAIRAAYEANDVSIRALATKYGVSHPAIHKRAKAEEWTRAPRPDLKHTGNVSIGEATAAPAIPSLAEVAMVDPKVLVSQGRDLVARLFDELSASTMHRGELEKLIVEDTRDDADGRRRYAMMKAVNLSTRAAVLKNLATASKTLSETVPTLGKKEEARDRAAAASKSGRFATPPMPPKLVVNNVL